MSSAHCIQTLDDMWCQEVHRPSDMEHKLLLTRLGTAEIAVHFQAHLSSHSQNHAQNLQKKRMPLGEERKRSR